MEVIVAVLAFAGSLFAAVGTAAFISRLRSERSGWLGAWSVAAAALCASLGVVAIGHFLGFGPTTFRLYQVTGSLIAPVWLGIGVIQLLARKVPPKFLSWLWGGAFTFVAVIIMAVDPVNKSSEFGKSLPFGSDHWNQPPAYLLIAGHAVVTMILVVGLVLAILRWRNGDEYDADNMHAMLVLMPTGVAMIASFRLDLPGLVRVGLLAVMAAAFWYVILRPLAPYEDEEDEEEESDSGGWDRDGNQRAAAGSGDRKIESARTPASSGPATGGHARVPAAGWRAEPPAARSATAEHGMPGVDRPAPGRQGRRRSGLGDLVAEYRASDREAEYAGRMRPSHDDSFDGQGSGYGMGGDPALAPQRGRHRDTGAHALPGRDTGAHALPGGRDTGAHARSGRGRRARPDRYDQEIGPGSDLPSAGGYHPGPEIAGHRASGNVRPSSSIYGLLTVFTLMDGAGEAFDRLAEETVEGVRRYEPDNLIFVCHGVKQAPLQRIVYELYRDEAAYREHQRQPHVERFVTERQSLVLATNVIELNVNAAKSVPLPSAFPV
ncbi:Quinol monooxygenase YgiN [Thermostaphylospora chromogena]|uniref:Quinol monooxygenase YgiN n=1 Tax=Thermostaphylospora chromogena TaxID=35622 RepID=A0A1H1DGX6_9ACTN|nr:Quinol monooxygenase YgiN [Thermostaphylospora chromogena]